MAKRVLITFLGRVPKAEGQYRTTCYKWPTDNDKPCQPIQKVAFFGLDILRRMPEIDRVVVLGTPGSMWDHLFELDVSLADKEEDLRLKLVDQVERQNVSQSLLDQLQPVLAQAWGCQVRLEIISSALTAQEQLGLFSELNNQVNADDRLILDITHSFRHLPMIMLLVAMQLKQLKGVQVDKVLYGMYDPDSQFAQVVDLKGLLDIADWMQALVTFKKDGDYGVFADLVDVPLLKEAAFFERTTNPVKARETLRGARAQLEEKRSTDPIWHYFGPDMLAGFAWIDQQARHRWEADLAWRYLDRKDYLRSILYALESCISREVSQLKGDHHDFAERQHAHDLLREKSQDYRKLNNLRNSMAHGTQTPRNDMKKTLKNEQALVDQLKRLYTSLNL